MQKFREIAAHYEETKSLRQTAYHFQISQYAVRRVLITLGLYNSKQYREIQRLMMNGLSADEVALKLEVKPSVISGYLPYVKGSYKLSRPTDNALRIRESRNRRKI